MPSSAPAILHLPRTRADIPTRENGASCIPAPSRPRPADSTGFHPTTSMWLALGQLLKAHDTAQQFRLPTWEFAVEIDVLEKTGCDHNDLRALVCQGLIEHGVETSRLRGKRRTFRHTHSLRFARASCFVLSELGATAGSRDWPHLSAADSGHGKDDPLGSPGATLPSWDASRHELRLGHVVVKRFRQPARNQQAVLAAFQEEGWPARIDSPIPEANGDTASLRLHHTIKRLNRQPRRLIRFECDGSGEGVTWRLSE